MYIRHSNQQTYQARWPSWPNQLCLCIVPRIYRLKR